MKLAGENPAFPKESSQHGRRSLATETLKGLRQNPAFDPEKDAVKQGMMTSIRVGGRWKS